MGRPERSCRRREASSAARLHSCSSSPIGKHGRARMHNAACPSQAEQEQASCNALATLDAAAKVKNNLRIFNMCYLQANKEEAERCQGKENRAQRPDLKAIAKMREMRAILQPNRLIGSFPGVNVGDRFFSRAELVTIGLHHHWLNGIDYIGKLGAKASVKGDYELPLATSIIISGGYEDDVDNSEDVIYTGQGGNNLNGDRRQQKDQVMDRGNLALKNCIASGTPVRVVRGHDSRHSYTKRVYTYDGLYKVVEYWAQKGISGFTVYKYRLQRCAGQPALTTEQVQFKQKIPKSPLELQGLIRRDISNGLENLPIPASNTVDPPAAPDGFRYVTKVELGAGIMPPPPAKGCRCVGKCTDSRQCSCAKLNGNKFPYVNSHGGRLLEATGVVYECGPSCGCDPDCLNRTSQQGLRYRLEVFKTARKGWGVRSWDPIPAGAPVCEYFGKVLKAEGLNIENDVYIFDLDCIQTMRGIDGRQRRWGDLRKFLDDQNGEVTDSHCVPEEVGHAEYCLDGSEHGSVARFINHSCDPNLFIQCVLSSHHDIRIPRVVLFAADNISPLEELSYDYGYQVGQVFDNDGNEKQLLCNCGALSCKKRLY